VRDVVLDEDTGTALVVVDYQEQPLAIGKEGLNAKLAARLTGWRIDIRSEEELAYESEVASQPEGVVPEAEESNEAEVAEVAEVAKEEGEA
jgi:N utilization substance protein A